ncbi:V8-like Glu-specific endopeptidase [Seinonella peptonophila]|uniref:V8-like Glu-specific endopeptidase n=1 Tax=Seinonella peptonophila TaxID=112248 RepID=A0A1M4XSF7_9BACL|nr:trypsin-like serine protease [Seinonella peptonophila]SHE96514.1 V8-like Glu-specific endopeptidase [Seinonella peptonophila]
MKHTISCAVSFLLTALLAVFIWQERAIHFIPAIQSTDHRVLVKQTDQDPYTSIVPLTIEKRSTTEEDNQKYLCTGFVIASKVIATAGHCLKNALSISLPSGQQEGEVIHASKFAQSATGQDYGVIFLSQPLNQKPFELAQFEQDAPPSLTAGFPGDKPADTMWQAHYTYFFFAKKIDRLVAPGVAIGGQSGSPFFREQKNNRFVASAILVESSCHKNQTCPKGTSFFLRFTASVVQEFQHWITQSE